MLRSSSIAFVLGTAVDLANGVKKALQAQQAVKG